MLESKTVEEAKLSNTFIVGTRLSGRSEAIGVEAEDALIAALKVKHEVPNAVITYVRKQNARGDRRHPHPGVKETNDRD